MTDETIEAQLRELGTRLDVPEPPDGARTAVAVLTRLNEPAPRPANRLLPRLVAAAVALLLALAVAMTVSPTVRAAVLDFLRIGGVELRFQPPPVPPTSDPVLPGERDVTLAQAREQAAFDVKVPALLGDPESVRLIEGFPPSVVSLHYQGVRIDQFDGTLHPYFGKFTRAEDVVPTKVDGFDAVWVPRPHVVIYIDRAGTERQESARLATHTLIWEAGGLTYRVEGDLTRTQAIAIAESLG